MTEFRILRDPLQREIRRFCTRIPNSLLGFLRQHADYGVGDLGDRQNFRRHARFFSANDDPCREYGDRLFHDDRRFFRAALWADFVLFIIAMARSLVAAIVAVNLPEAGGLHALLMNEYVEDKLSFFHGFNNTTAVVPLYVTPLAIQWWSSWYSGAELGGGCYTA